MTVQKLALKSADVSKRVHCRIGCAMLLKFVIGRSHRTRACQRANFDHFSHQFSRCSAVIYSNEVNEDILRFISVQYCRIFSRMSSSHAAISLRKQVNIKKLKSTTSRKSLHRLCVKQ